MLEYAALASAAIGIITPFLKKGAEKMAEKMGESAWAERASIWESVKGFFDGDDELITLFGKYPDSAEMQKDVTAKLEEKLAAAPEAAKELQEKIDKMPAEIKTNTITQSGDGNIANQDISGSTITINK